MSRLPIVEKRKRKSLHKKELRKVKEISEQENQTPAISKTQAKRNRREKDRIRKKAGHKLAFFDRLFGLGRGPVALRMRWLDRFIGK